LVEVGMDAGNKVLIDVDDNTLLAVGNPQLILDQQLKPHPIHLLIIIIILINSNKFFN
jgi:hypothetical protein